jgi:G3E family GTPase
MKSEDRRSEVNDAKSKARYIMIGGFLGAGKTTAVAKLATHLGAQGLRVGLITNDQGSQLVDTAMLAAHGFPVEEISGGCFCCRFNSLVDAAKKLSAETRPDIFIAEPVGSCTDLVATVSYPLRRIYGDAFTIAPLSVLVDPIRAMRVLGLSQGGRFSEKVSYIYRKQLEEADLIAVNKCDLVSADEVRRLREALLKEFPKGEVIEISARTGAGLDGWFERIAGQQQSTRPAIAVDYELYAEGEALLGWLNATVELSSSAPFDGNAILKHLAGAMQEDLGRQGAEIAHLKMTLDPADGIGDLAVINLVRSDYVAELSQELQDPLQAGQLTVNVRAEIAPDGLKAALEEALNRCSVANASVRAVLEHLEFFQPGKPQPTHRIAVP